MLITQFWDDKAVPKEVQDLMHTVKKCNPEAQCDIFDLPEARALLEKHLTPREVKALDACAVPAMQADYFRYCALLIRGGWYLDADTRCFQSLTPLQPHADSGHNALLFKRTWSGPVINGFMWFRKPTHLFMRAVLDTVTTSIERRVSNDVWAAVGAAHLTFLTLFELDDQKALDDWRYNRLMTPDRAIIMDICEEVIKSGKYRGFLDDVLLMPLSETVAFWDEAPLVAYKKSALDWRNWPGSIYA